MPRHLALLDPTADDDAIEAFVAALKRKPLSEATLAEHHPGGHNHNQLNHGGHGHRKPVGDTMSDHSSGGAFDAERSAFHDQVIASKLAGVPTSAEPTLYMTGGGAASGKTQGLLKNDRVGIPNKSLAAHIDPDSMKMEIPEYQEGVAAGVGWAASRAHEESSYMAKLGATRALATGHDVVFDSVGDSGIDKLSAKVAAFRAAGATRVRADYATVPTHLALERAQARAARTGRVVPTTELVRAHADVSRTYLAATQRGTFDSMSLWDTTTRTPTLVQTFDKATGVNTVYNQTLWDAFVAKGQ